MVERLQRVLAEHGVTSRRKAEEMIVAGRVTVDGQVVSELGVRVDPARQDVRVDGQRIRLEPRRYIMLNKPSGYITTVSDERDRRTVMDLINVRERVVPVGRLDRQTAGLLLLTNDGDLAFRVTHPRYELEKEYEALVDGFPPAAALDTLRRGVTVEGERVVPDQVRPLRNEEAGTLLRIVIHEGRNRIVRRMLERIGYPVVKLVRTRVGPLQVRGLATGAWRDLTPGELEQLQEALHMGEPDQREARPSRAPDREAGTAPRRGPGRTAGPPGSDRPSGGRPPVRRGERPPRRDDERATPGGPPRRDDRQGRPDRRPRRDDERATPGGPPRRGGRQDRPDRPSEDRRPREGDRARPPASGRPPRDQDRRPERAAPGGPPRDRDRRPAPRPSDDDTAPRRARQPRDADTPPADQRPARRGPGGRPPVGGRPGKPGPRRAGPGRGPSGPPAERRSGAGERPTYGRKRDSTRQTGKPAGDRDRRPGGGRQDNRGGRRRPPA